MEKPLTKGICLEMIDIPGLSYINNFIDTQEQDSLIKQIDNQEWLQDLSRRTQHYGYKYDYTKKSVDQSLFLGPLPDWLKLYTNKLTEQKIFDKTPDQVIINEYLPGQGISRHVDCVPCFDNTIASLSLNSVCLMQFEQLKTAKKEEMLLDPLSLLVLKNDARYGWMHSIPARKEDVVNSEIITRQRRISLTFRAVIRN